MTQLAWKPWHQVVRLRDDLRSGELPLSIFAADLYDVVMRKARPVYQEPSEFFALTYPTYNLRELAKEVVLRLAGKNDKAVRQLELTYGGGKTHTLITLYHLVRDPVGLPALPAVQEFLQHIGMTPPQARIAVLAFDKLDAEKGMEILGPKGQARWLKHPWSVLAYQIADSDGLRLLHPDGQDAERESAPAENLLADLLARPASEGLALLILIDEVLMYAREKVGLNPEWRSRLLNFFQYLTQAAVKAPNCAVVASLLATDPRKSDTLGKELTQELYAIFQRQKEESVQPVLKEDAAEVLRRRFFTPESIRDREAFRPHVVAALQGIVALDEQTAKEGKAAEERLLHSYPFHPNLTDIFYTKWTNLEGFQRTRGVLRTFALALRDAEAWDECPLVGANVFLGLSEGGGLSEGARELTIVAETEEYEGKSQKWTSILESELTKAREIQAEAAGVRFREIEQTVFATFLHSQPIGQKVSTRDLLLLLGQSRPDKIGLEKALRQWAEVSWFLDEGEMSEAQGVAHGSSQLPRFWRLGSKPNLRQMHHDAFGRIRDDLAEAKLLEEIGKLSSLKSASGVRVHPLPQAPNYIEQDEEFHFAILGPKAASEPGRPSAEARRFLDETTGPDRPRTKRNAVVLAVPSRDGLEAARNAIREYLGWLEVGDQLKSQEIDTVRREMLRISQESAQRKIPETIRQAYCIVVTVSEKNEVEAFKVTVGTEPLFTTIKNDKRARIQETAVTAGALLPGGPYDLWREGEEAHRVKDLVGAFAERPWLPKMLKSEAIRETLIAGCREGIFVLRQMRPDHSYRTFWREEPDERAIKDPGLEAVLPEQATLDSLALQLLTPGVLPGLWKGATLTIGDLVSYFAGGKVIQVQREGYTEPITIPKASREVIEEALRAAVRSGQLWLIAGAASLWQEDIPAGLLTDDARLQERPQPISPKDLLPPNLPEAWVSEITTARAILDALSTKIGKPLPWAIVRQAIEGAFAANFLERPLDSGPWPCDLGGALAVRVRLPLASPPPPPSTPPVSPPAPAKTGALSAAASLRTHQVQELAEQLPALTKAAVGLDLSFYLGIEIKRSPALSEEVIEKINQVLQQVSEELKLR
jgi:hypothetical protein